ncbi:TPA: hypothetical protein N0X38_002529 [Acinetobacter baumannii]|uniref:hypothetical protein n=1 Tax=Acinetobacter baumannii TaxID=470 RepID=UPI000DE5F95A|nr:hypothetical protein [Acinetobacter baumannii]MCT9291364.1 hypothetical protein [Acinetobacter baumannii]MDC5334429.1 hypothetical protein [Acinetobacter baumannii]MDV7405748.1 hypothetical protein [Acinetobacter baumannii]SSM82445.1 Uncharacterised protein [Acinetobacter baumannii]SSM84318.1 Uncharacterised protein [Acinetobacter baumannii]
MNINFCSIDWNELFKLVTPFIITFLVYNFWHRQKSKEVVANEVKDLLKSVLEEASVVALLKFETQLNMDLIKAKIERLDSLNQTIFRSTLFIKLCIKDSNLEKLLESYTSNSNNLFIKFKRNLLNVAGPINYKDSLSLYADEYSAYTKSLEKVIAELAPYSTYKKKLKIPDFPKK